MGCCCNVSSNQDSTVQNIEEEKNTILILGIEGTGKTTLLHQIQRIYGNGFSESDRCRFRIQIWQQITKTLLSMIQILSDDDGLYPEFTLNDDNHGNYKQAQIDINPKLQDSVDFINELPHDLGEMSDDIEDNIKQFVPHIKNLWNDKAIEIIYDRRYNYFKHIPDSTQYFVENIERVCDKNYIPTDEDILRHSRPNNAIFIKRFTMDQLQYPNCIDDSNMFKFISISSPQTGLLHVIIRRMVIILFSFDVHVYT